VNTPENLAAIEQPEQRFADPDLVSGGKAKVTTGFTFSPN